MLTCQTMTYTEYKNLVLQYLRELANQNRGQHVSIHYRRFKKWLRERNIHHGGIRYATLFYDTVKEFLNEHAIPYVEHPARRCYYILVLDVPKLKQKLLK